MQKFPVDWMKKEWHLAKYSPLHCKPGSILRFAVSVLSPLMAHPALGSLATPRRYDSAWTYAAINHFGNALKAVVSAHLP